MNLDSIKKHRIKMILRYSIPSIIAMVLTALITVIDGFFIGNYVGKDGIAAVNLGLPIVYLFLAVGLMISVGGVAIAGISLGARDSKKCNEVFNQTISTTVVASFVLSFLMLLCLEPILQILNANQEVSTYFKEYYIIMLLQLPIMVINSSFGMFIRGEGNPRYFMNVTILNLALNIILNYLFVKSTHFGITGIAIASLISTLFSSLFILLFFFKKSKIYKIKKFSFSKDVFKNTIFNGSSEFIGQMSMSISMFAYNLVIIKEIGLEGITAFSIVGYVSYIFSMIIIGFGQGVSPLTSFAYGAKEYKLASSIRRSTNIIVFIVGVFVFLVLSFGSSWYSNLFVKSEVIADMVDSGMIIFAVSFLFSGVNTITSFYFTSVGKAKESAIISASRGVVVLLICIFTLPILLGMTGVWLVAPITEGVTLMISLWFIHKNCISPRF